MDVKRNQLIEIIVWVGIPMLFRIVDWVCKHVFNIEYLELSILLFVVATIYKTYQNKNKSLITICFKHFKTR